MAHPTSLESTSTAIYADVPRTGTWDGGNEPFKASYGKLMMWFFLLSDAFTFGAFLTAYGMIRHKHGVFVGTADKFFFSTAHWPIPEKVFNGFPGLHGLDLPLAFVALMTMILIFSSVTMVLAVEAGHRMDKADVQKWLLWTILFGTMFLSSQAWEWSHFIGGSEKGLLMADGSVMHGANLATNEYGPPCLPTCFSSSRASTVRTCSRVFACWFGALSLLPTVLSRSAAITRWWRKSAFTGTLLTWCGYSYSRSSTWYK